jgi:hypothetical protein
MQFNLEPVRTYASQANALKAVDKKFSKDLQDTLHWYIAEKDNRFFPVFVGQNALQSGAHFHFNVVG